MMLLGLALTVFWMLHPARAESCISNCTRTIADEMNTGGGWVMFAVGLVGGFLILVVGWMLMRRRAQASVAPEGGGRIISAQIMRPHLYARVTEGYI
jgi:uncharacterized membrane protein